MTFLCRAPPFRMERLARLRDSESPAEAHHAGHLFPGAWNGFAAPLRRLRLWPDPALGRPTMVEQILALVIAAALGGYLLFALLQPEKF